MTTASELRKRALAHTFSEEANLKRLLWPVIAYCDEVLEKSTTVRSDQRTGEFILPERFFWVQKMGPLLAEAYRARDIAVYLSLSGPAYLSDTRVVIDLCYDGYFGGSEYNKQFNGVKK